MIDFCRSDKSQAMSFNLLFCLFKICYIIFRMTLQPDFILRVLDSIYRKGHPEDYVAYFEETKEKIKGHGLAFIRAAKIYHYLDNADCIEKVETSLIDYARIGWVPINHTMVTPMTLFCYPVLFSYYSIPLLKRILHSEKSCF